MGSCLIGCKPKPDTDVTSSPQYNFSAFAGTVWKTKVKTAVVDVENYKGARVVDLVVPKHFDPKDPHYDPNETARIVSEVPPGARLRIDHLMKDNGIWGGLWVTGTLEDGTNTQRTVKLDGLLLEHNQFISPAWSPSTNWAINTEMLEKP